MFNKLAKTVFLMVLSVTIAMIFTGCDEEEIAAVPAAEQVDLAQTEDLFSKPIQPNPLTTDPNAVLIRVNGEEITRGDVQEWMAAAMQQVAGQVPPQQLQQMQAQMYQRIKDDLINKTLLEAAMAAANVVVSEEDIAKTIEQVKSRPLPEGMTFEAALAAQGTTLEELTENIKEQLETRQFLESKTEGIVDATEEEAKEFYDSNPDRFKKPESIAASHILLKLDDTITNEVEIAAMKTEKKAQLEKIRTDIISGTNTFEEAAAHFSDCPSKAQGGSLGPFGKGQMVPEFEVAAFTQEVGEVGDVVETQFGYHIIKVSDHQEEGVVAFDESKEQIVDFLSNQKKQEAVQAFIKSLRDSATIEVVSEQ